MSMDLWIFILGVESDIIIISLLKLLQLRQLGTLLSWLVCLFDMPLFLFSENDALSVPCIFPAPALGSVISLTLVPEFYFTCSVSTAIQI